jgi:hypothetical protein
VPLYSSLSTLLHKQKIPQICEHGPWSNFKLKSSNFIQVQVPVARPGNSEKIDSDGSFQLGVEGLLIFKEAKREGWTYQPT